jgi:DNA-3-methyladenine glycosylase II
MQKVDSQISWQEVCHRDPIMDWLSSKISLPVLSATKDLFQDIIRAIIAQQLSTKAAATIFTRFMSITPTEDSLSGFILNVNPQILREAGISSQKCTYIQEVATYFEKHALFDGNWQEWRDEEIVETLTKIKGVGVWTVQMLLIFSLNRNDVFPPDDLAIQQQMAKYYKLSSRGNVLKKEMCAIAESWRPHRSLASRLLWASKGIEVNL